MANIKSYYEILEVRDDASQEVIKMAYKALCLKFHPDTTILDKEKSYEHMQRINAAYEILSDIERRKHYDAGLRYSNSSTYYNKETENAEERRRKEQASRAEASRKQAEAARAAEQRMQQENLKQAKEREAERLRKKKLFEEQRKADKEKRKQKLNKVMPKLFDVFQVFLAVVLVCILVFSNIIQPIEAYAEASENMKQGKYVSAYSTFLLLADFRDSKVMAQECMDKLRINGKCGKFVASVLTDTDFDIWDNEEYFEWIGILEDINRFGDYDQRGQEAKYQLASLFYYKDAYNHASKIFQELGTYKYSKEYLSICEGKMATDAQ